MTKYKAEADGIPFTVYKITYETNNKLNACEITRIIEKQIDKENGKK